MWKTQAPTVWDIFYIFEFYEGGFLVHIIVRNEITLFSTQIFNFVVLHKCFFLFQMMTVNEMMY